MNCNECHFHEREYGDCWCNQGKYPHADAWWFNLQHQRDHGCRKGMTSGDLKYAGYEMRYEDGIRV